MRKLVTACVLVAGVTALPGATHAAPIHIKFASPAARNGIMIDGFEPWVAKVNRDAGGSLDLKTYYSLVNHRNAYDFTINGVVGISWVIMGPYAGQFPRTQVASLPFEGGSGYATSVALWHLYENGLIAPEYNKIKLLALFSFPSSGFHTQHQIRTLDDLKGVKLGLTGRTLGEFAKALGATPITMTPADWYESVKRGVISGVLTAWPAVKSYKLQEVTHYHLDGAFGRAPAFVFMNKAAFARLPKKARDTLMKDSAMELSTRLGALVDQEANENRKFVESLGQDVSDLSEVQSVIWQERAQSVVDRWIAHTPNGAKILAAYRTEYAQALKSE